MKTCKKILASVLALAMVLSMCTFAASADETTATSKLVSKHTFDGLTAGSTISQSGTSSKAVAADSDSVAGGPFYLRGKKNNGSATIVAKADGDNYISSTHRHMGYNHRVSNVSGVSGATGNFTSLGYGTDFPVLHASYDIRFLQMMPTEQTKEL